ncbi:hypothetical protein E2C01_029178 [Portunus trituberculatus]|uniref:Uncharacterized protein n=1 Tax=Portunus trituberculatus TaxID=210409 RepID=A0A5B7ETY9_PORTR|nr:hypothetical protein [Portunus trituberculatus]
MRRGRSSGASTYQPAAELSGVQFEIASGAQFENAVGPNRIPVLIPSCSLEKYNIPLHSVSSSSFRNLQWHQIGGENKKSSESASVSEPHPSTSGFTGMTPDIFMDDDSSSNDLLPPPHLAPLLLYIIHLQPSITGFQGTYVLVPPRRTSPINCAHSPPTHGCHHEFTVVALTMGMLDAVNIQQWHCAGLATLDLLLTTMSSFESDTEYLPGASHEEYSNDSSENLIRTL